MGSRTNNRGKKPEVKGSIGQWQVDTLGKGRFTLLYIYTTISTMYLGLGICHEMTKVRRQLGISAFQWRQLARLHIDSSCMC